MTAVPPGGRPMPCLVTGAAMLALPTVVALTAPPVVGSAAARALALAAVVVLAVGAGSVAAVVARPGLVAAGGLAVLCAGLALVFSPVEPWADGLTGLAALAFLLATRLHAESARRPVEVGEWLAARRPLVLGAAVTTPAAIAAALVPAAWSLPVAGLVGIAVAGLCAAVLAN